MRGFRNTFHKFSLTRHRNQAYGTVVIELTAEKPTFFRKNNKIQSFCNVLTKVSYVFGYTEMTEKLIHNLRKKLEPEHIGTDIGIRKQNI